MEHNSPSPEQLENWREQKRLKEFMGKGAFGQASEPPVEQTAARTRPILLRAGIPPLRVLGTLGALLIFIIAALFAPSLYLAGYAHGYQQGRADGRPEAQR